MNLEPPAEYDLADRIGKLTNGTTADVAITALVMNICHIMFLANMSVADLVPVLDKQMEITRLCMKEVRKFN